MRRIQLMANEKCGRSSDTKIYAIHCRTAGEKAIATIISIFIWCHPAFSQDFVRAEDEAGLGHVTTGNGVAVADYDKDGDLDIFMVGYESFKPGVPSTWNRLLENKGQGMFEDVTIRAGFGLQFINTGIKAERGEKMGAAWGDYDNDGYPDLFLTNSRGDELYHNEGNGTFVNVTAQAGVGGCNDCYSSSALWWDFDRDRDLDLYVSRINGYNVMYENTGGGVFRDVTRALGLTGAGITWASVPIDVNGDGWLDLYVVNDTQKNQLFVNNGAGKGFKEATGLYGTDDPGAGMGVAIGDYNNDGRFDIYVTNIYNHHPNPLYTCLPEGNYRNDARRLGVDNTGWGWGTHFFDFDNDGDEDIYAVNGVEENQYIFNEVQTDVENVFFKNTLAEGKEGFVDWSEESGTNLLARARGLEAFDYDDDGDLDLVVANSQGKIALFRNNTIHTAQTNTQNWIKLRLEGTFSNRDAIGTRIKIIANGKSYYRWHQGAGFLDQSLKPVHFGIGAAFVIDEILIKWPNGLTEKISNVPANQTLHLTEGSYIRVVEENNATPTTPAPLVSVNSYPNPFHSSTVFRCMNAGAGVVEIRIISNQGREVFRSKQFHAQSGELNIPWDGTDKSGSYVPGGVYYFVAYLGERQFNGKILKLNGN